MTQVCDLLLAQGPEGMILWRDKTGRTPARWAKFRGHEALQSHLEAVALRAQA